MIHDPLRRQVLFVALIVAGAALLWASAALQTALLDALQLSKALVQQYPIASRVAFVALAALSAMLVLFSSVALVPVAVHAWGEQQTFGLLMLGWFIGANLAYLIGRRYGRRAAEHFVAAQTLERYEHLLSARMSVVEVTLVKLALPSEVPSFLLGIVRYPVRKLVPVLLASELPFAAWAVFLSAALLEDRRLVFVAVLLAGFGAVAIVTRRLLLRHY